MDGTDRLVRTIYAHVTLEDWEHFRPRALEDVALAFGAAAAAWITRSNRGSVWGEFTSYPATLAISPQRLMQLEFRKGERLALPADMSINALRQGVAMSHVHHMCDLTSHFAFWYGGDVPQERMDELGAVLGHLSEASSLALHRYIMRDEWLGALGRPNRGTSALIDAAGTIYAASRRFRELVSEAFATADFAALPFALPEEAFSEEGLFGQGNLRFRTAKMDELYLLHARRPLPLDGLSPREQQIARALGNGKTFKTVARQCGIAVSTVANHASRIYRKLGIYRREDLVELMRSPPRHSARH